MSVNSLPKTVTWQRRSCDLNPGPSAPESSTLSTRLPSHDWYNVCTNKRTRKDVRDMKLLSRGSSEARTISDHALSVIQSGAGLGCGFCSATPPVNRNLQTWSSTSFLNSHHQQWHYYKEFWKSVNTWGSYGQEFGVLFFWLTVQKSRPLNKSTTT